MLPGTQKSILGDLFCHLSVAKRLESHAENQAAVAVVQFAQGVWLRTRHQPQQGFVAGRGDVDDRGSEELGWGERAGNFVENPGSAARLEFAGGLLKRSVHGWNIHFHTHQPAAGRQILYCHIHISLSPKMEKPRVIPRGSLTAERTGSA